MKHASYSKRFIAFIIDNFILTIIFFIIKFFIIQTINVNNFSLEYSLFIFIIPFLVCWLITMLYFGLMESSKYQASFGKRIMGIKVCSENGERISIIKSITRNANKFLSGFFLMSGYFLIFFSKKNQALHDWLSDVVIIED